MSNAPDSADSPANADGDGRKKLTLTRKPAPASAPAARGRSSAGGRPSYAPQGDRPRSGGGERRSFGGRDDRFGGPRDARDARDGGRDERFAPRPDRKFGDRPQTGGYGRDERGGGFRENRRDDRPRDGGRPSAGGYDRDERGGDFRDSRRDDRPRDGGRPSAGGFGRDERRGDARDARRDDRPRDGGRPSFGPRVGPRPTPSNVWRADAAPRTMQTAAAQAQNVQLKEEGQIRVNKRMSDLGLCSRREGDAWIENGWVLVNGEVATMGQLVSETDKIEIQREAQEQQAQQVTILINKPMGYVSGQAEDGHEPAMVLLNPPNHWREDHSATRFNFSQLKGLAPCGRLDIDSVGLLVLTQDGRVAKQIIGEDSEMDKEYLVRVTFDGRDKDVQSHFPAERLAMLRHGLSLDGEALLPAEVEWQNPEQLRFVLREGKKRQIRRMCEAVGLFVVGLKRIRIGKVVLGNLPVGQWRYLGADEQF